MFNVLKIINFMCLKIENNYEKNKEREAPNILLLAANNVGPTKFSKLKITIKTRSKQHKTFPYRNR